MALEVERESLRQQLATLREKGTRPTEDDRRSLELQRSAMVAMVALGLQRLPDADHPRETKFGRFLRKWLIRWRFRWVRTVKVPIEVLVEQEVEKVVERPVEKIVKEILYVPILTDDPEAVRKFVDWHVSGAVRYY